MSSSLTVIVGWIFLDIQLAELILPMMSSISTKYSGAGAKKGHPAQMISQ
jgi:hypothetical protein